jgi:hypothetical protein
LKYATAALGELRVDRLHVAEIAAFRSLESRERAESRKAKAPH